MLSKLRFFLVFIAATVVSVIAPYSVHALTTPPGPKGSGMTTPPGPSASTASQPDTSGLTNPLNNINSLPEFLNKILEAVVQLGTIVLILAIVYVGFLFVVAQGNEEKIKSARSALFWTVIGGLVLLGAQTIGLVISSTVGAL